MRTSTLLMIAASFFCGCEDARTPPSPRTSHPRVVRRPAPARPRPRTPEYNIEDAERNPKVVFRDQDPRFRNFRSDNFVLAPRQALGQYSGRRWAYSDGEEVWIVARFDEAQLESLKGCLLRIEVYAPNNRFLFNVNHRIRSGINPLPSHREKSDSLQRLGGGKGQYKVLFKIDGKKACLMYLRLD